MHSVLYIVAKEKQSRRVKQKIGEMFYADAYKN